MYILHQLTQFKLFQNLSLKMEIGVIVTIVIQSVLFLLALVKIYNDVQLKLKELDIRMIAVEKQDDEIYHKLDRMMEVIQEIKIQI